LHYLVELIKLANPEAVIEPLNQPGELNVVVGANERGGPANLWARRRVGWFPLQVAALLIVFQ